MKKRNKIIVGCVSALALVSVASVGLATWLVGVTQEAKNVSIKAEVDGVQNQIVYIDAALVAGSTVKVAEDSPVPVEGTTIVGTAQNAGESGIQVSADALNFTFDNITIRVGSSATSVPDKVIIELDDKTSTCNQVKDEANLLGDTYRDNEGNDSVGYWTYLAFRTEIAIDGTNFSSRKEGEFTTYTWNGHKVGEGEEMSKTYKLGRGTFFNNHKPTTFYNDDVVSKNKVTKFNDLLSLSNKAYSELDAMKDALTAEGAGLTLKVSLGFSE